MPLNRIDLINKNEYICFYKKSMRKYRCKLHAIPAYYPVHKAYKPNVTPTGNPPVKYILRNSRNQGFQ